MHTHTPTAASELHVWLLCLVPTRARAHIACARTQHPGVEQCVCKDHKGMEFLAQALLKCVRFPAVGESNSCAC